MLRLQAIVMAGAIGTACGGTPLQPETPDGGSLAVRHVTGVVRDEKGDPIAGASVTSPQATSAVLTDQAGQFDLTVDRPQEWILVTASKIDYESGAQQTQGPTRDLTLRRIRIAVGESLRMTVGPNDTLYMDQYLDEYRFRTVRVTASESTRAELRLVAEDGGPVGVEGSYSYLSVDHAEWLRTPMRAVVNVAGGTEIVATVRIPWGNLGVSRTFTLITSRLGP